MQAKISVPGSYEIRITVRPSAGRVIIVSNFCDDNTARLTCDGLTVVGMDEFVKYVANTIIGGVPGAELILAFHRILGDWRRFLPGSTGQPT